MKRSAHWLEIMATAYVYDAWKSLPPIEWPVNLRAWARNDRILPQGSRGQIRKLRTLHKKS